MSLILVFDWFFFIHINVLPLNLRWSSPAQWSCRPVQDTLDICSSKRHTFPWSHLFQLADRAVPVARAYQQFHLDKNELIFSEITKTIGTKKNSSRITLSYRWPLVGKCPEMFIKFINDDVGRHSPDPLGELCVALGQAHLAIRIKMMRKGRRRDCKLFYQSKKRQRLNRWFRQSDIVLSHYGKERVRESKENLRDDRKREKLPEFKLLIRMIHSPRDNF